MKCGWCACDVRALQGSIVRVSVGGSFAATWARMVLKRCSSERGERWTAAVSSVLDFEYVYLFTYF